MCVRSDFTDQMMETSVQVTTAPAGSLLIVLMDYADILVYKSKYCIDSIKSVVMVNFDQTNAYEQRF
jgi:hypothetical protein